MPRKQANPCRSTPSTRNPRFASAVGVWLAVAAAVPMILPQPAAHGDVTGAQVKRALKAGVRWLKSRQQRNGSWPERYHAGGESCLATLALLQAGEPLDSRTVSRALRFVRRIENEHVYVVSLKIMALVKADARGYRREIAEATKWLVGAQNETGLWSYTHKGGRFDHSNSQFALLGLHAAAQAGVTVPRAVWQRAQGGVLRTQNADGGWSYRQGGRSYGSMTAAGVSDLLILGNTARVRRERGFRNGSAPQCGEYRTNRPLVNGLNWLASKFRARDNPGRGNSYHYYWLYGAERCGMLSGQRSFGRHDWYREGAEFLVRAQGSDGRWTVDLANTCFAILYLAKGHKPLLAQKLRWSENARWNPDRNDLDHLVAFIGDKLGEPVAWQTTALDAPLEDWLAAPILYVQGHEFPVFNANLRAKLRKYVENGGTLLAEACCGRKAFREGFRAFAAQVFPEQPLRRLGPEHALYHSKYKLRAAGLEGIDVGCRTSVIFSPDDLSCLWEQGNVPKLSQSALELGTNIAAYASGLGGLRDRLDVVTLPETRAVTPGPAQRDAFRLAQIVYDGDWRPDPLALVRFVEFLRDELKMDVISQYRQVRLTDSDLYTCPLLYMTGHYAFEWSEPQRAALAAHLRRGGFLFVDACCGREAFDRAFRKAIARTFPEQELKLLPAEHEIYGGEPGFRIESVKYKETVHREEPDLKTPSQWGLELDGRLAVVYSPYSLGCGLDGHTCFNCRGVVTEDAQRMAANVVLYALTH